MKKLALQIDALEVQSFEISASPEAARGTVHGADAARGGSFGSACGVTLCTCAPDCQWTV